MPIAERLLAKCIPEPNSGCWLWTASIAGSPNYPEHHYGCFWDGKKTTTAHRAAYECFVGTVDKNMEVGHRCHNKLCINPDHLEVMTHGRNMQDTVRTRKTHCNWGHPLSGDNLYITPDGRRMCKACRSVRSWERQQVMKG